MKKQYLSRIVLAGTLAAGLMTVGPKAWADETAQLRDQVQALQNRVNLLEAQLGNQQPVVPAQWDDPFAQMMLMRDQIDHSLRQAFADTGVFSPKMDMKQTDKQYIITMDIPGMDKNKINVEAKEGMLIISGERQSEKQDNKSNQYYRQERSFGTFMQAIPLPEDAQKDQIDAHYKNGVLTVTVGRAKKEEKKPEDQKIAVQ